MTTTANHKTFTARVSYDPINYDWVEILAVKTGSVLTLEMEGRDPSEFTGIERVLWKDITEGKIANESQVALTVEEGRAFRAMVSRNKGTAEIHSDRLSRKIVSQVEAKQFGLGKDELDRRISGLQAVCRMVKEDFVELSYDIDEIKKESCPNPSAKLHRSGFCFRRQYSLWVLPKSKLSDPVIVELTRHWDKKSINYDVFTLAKEENEKVRRLAARKLHEFLVRCHTSLITRIANADQALADLHKQAKELEKPLTAKECHHAEQARLSKIRAAINDVTKDFAGAVKLAETYELTECVEDLKEGLRAAIRAEAAAFNAVARERGMKRASFQ